LKGFLVGAEWYSLNKTPKLFYSPDWSMCLSFFGPRQSRGPKKRVRKAGRVSGKRRNPVAPENFNAGFSPDHRNSPSS
jgi:hypothetical protein